MCSEDSQSGVCTNIQTKIATARMRSTYRYTRQRCVDLRLDDPIPQFSFRIEGAKIEKRSNYQILAYKAFLQLYSVGQLDKRLYCGTATGAGTGVGDSCDIFEIDALFQVKDQCLGDGLRWGHS